MCKDFLNSMKIIIFYDFFWHLKKLSIEFRKTQFYNSKIILFMNLNVPNKLEYEYEWFMVNKAKYFKKEKYKVMKYTWKKYRKYSSFYLWFKIQNKIKLKFLNLNFWLLSHYTCLIFLVQISTLIDSLFFFNTVIDLTIYTCTFIYYIFSLQWPIVVDCRPKKLKDLLRYELR